HLLDARRAGHVHLCEASTDHIEPNKIKPLRAKTLAYGFDDSMIVFIELGLHHATSDVDVASKIIGAGNAQDGAKRLAIKEQDPLIAFGHGGQKLLNHHLAALVSRERLDDGVLIWIARAQLEDALA